MLSIKKATTAILTLITLFGVFPVVAFPLADPADHFLVTAPSPNSGLKGTTTTSFQVFDDEQATVPYEIRLFTSNCISNYGLISSGNAPSNANSNFTVNWPTTGPVADLPTISDGNYCLGVCVSLQNGAGNNYSACSLRGVTIRNNNRAPQITTQPPADKQVTPAEPWQYDVNATDPDGDALTYNFITAPQFLSIHPSTGLVFTNGTMKPIGNYTVTVVVSDNFGGSATQTWTISVVEPTPTPTPTPTPSPTPTPVPPPTTPNSPSVLKFLTPTAGMQFKGADNLISWQASDADGIENLRLYYLTDNVGAQLITTITDSTVTKYTWDVTNLDSGEYTLKLDLLDEKGQTATIFSDKFNISGKTTPGEDTTRPLIINVKPEDLSEITARRPEISGQFSPPIGGEIDPETFTITINGMDRTSWCNTTNQDFLCTPQEDIPVGANEVIAKVKDNLDQEAERKWVFKIIEPGATDGGNTIIIAGRTIPQSTALLALLVCCLALLLLFIPWFLYHLWRSRQETEVITEETTETVSDTPETTYDQPEVMANPSDFSSYEDYFKALNTTSAEPVATVNPTPNIEVNYVPTPNYNTFDSQTAAMPVLPPAQEININVNNNEPPDIMDSEPLAPAKEPIKAENKPDDNDPLKAYGYGIEDNN